MRRRRFYALVLIAIRIIRRGVFLYTEHIEDYLQFCSINGFKHKFVIYTIGEVATAAVSSDKRSTLGEAITPALSEF
jgi:hypothetical protein